MNEYMTSKKMALPIRDKVGSYASFTQVSYGGTSLLHLTLTPT